MFQCEFSNFLDVHWMWSLGITLGLEDAIKGRRVTESVVPLVIHVFPTEKGGLTLLRIILGGLLNEG